MRMIEGSENAQSPRIIPNAAIRAQLEAIETKTTTVKREATLTKDTKVQKSKRCRQSNKTHRKEITGKMLRKVKMAVKVWRLQMNKNLTTSSHKAYSQYRAFVKKGPIVCYCRSHYIILNAIDHR